MRKSGREKISKKLSEKFLKKGNFSSKKEILAKKVDKKRQKRNFGR